ncbi:hypothetical protein CsatB_002423 [Cannabis sativa]
MKEDNTMSTRPKSSTLLKCLTLLFLTCVLVASGFMYVYTDKLLVPPLPAISAVLAISTTSFSTVYNASTNNYTIENLNLGFWTKNRALGSMDYENITLFTYHHDDNRYYDIDDDDQKITDSVLTSVFNPNYFELESKENTTLWITLKSLMLPNYTNGVNTTNNDKIGSSGDVLWVPSKMWFEYRILLKYKGDHTKSKQVISVTAICDNVKIQYVNETTPLDNNKLDLSSCKVRGDTKLAWNVTLLCGIVFMLVFLCLACLLIIWRII